MQSYFQPNFNKKRRIIMQLTVEQRVFIVEKYLETKSLEQVRNLFGNQFPDRAIQDKKTVWRLLEDLPYSNQFCLLEFRERITCNYSNVINPTSSLFSWFFKMGSFNVWLFFFLI